MKTMKIVTALLFLVVFGSGYAYANLVRLALIDFSDFRKIEDNVYLSKSLPKDAEKKTLALLENARQRIAAKYGDPVASPVTVVLGNKKEQERYGLNGPPGTFLFAPWGGYLLLAFDKAEIDVTAHELVHAEIFSRVGYFKRQFEIPTWFDEGAAMQVDYRKKYTSFNAIDQAEFTQLISLDTPAKFWTSDKNQNIDNYRKSKAAIAKLFISTDEKLYSLLEQIKSGEGSTVISTVVNETNKALERTKR
ncbi:hypothetical protein [Marinomonas mediterranea]|uniref:hypothetical protein n=1 Tax=Marinomonas mediterranea TaxID=119864 RepID=UPI00234ADDCE|nr:hypothetical protein [Marinomonas mediterranea]WCN08729.1 hypothetical protein GV055_07175 [Marinomonas mediterranea]WCN12775.1 hypothetical protein GV054_06965 [Marinomonas mediterranea]